MDEFVRSSLNAIGMITVGNYISKVQGRRNWSVRLETAKQRAYIGGYGLMKSRGFLRESLQSISEHGITWIEFTYKKDLIDFILNLEKEGFSIIWVK